jgi:putative ABC transport system ATP-binding protein
VIAEPRPPALSLERVSKRYARGAREVEALSDVTLSVRAGESVAVTGPSGSGKSTLLSILGCLDKPTRGRYALDGEDVSAMDDPTLSRVRNRRIGFVFQSFHLIPQLTVVENVETPLLYSPVPVAQWRERALTCLRKVSLAHRSDHRPAELSGGEAQRAAIARALVCDPGVLLADEPTGNLDSATGDEIAGVLDALHREGRTLVVVTHNEALARRARRVVRLRDGRVEADEPA